jgi:hypothetical protein
MTYSGPCKYLDGEKYKGSFYTNECPDPSTSNTGWYADGRDHCGRDLWVLRNVAATLDLNRPLQTRSGLPVRYVGKGADGQLAFAIKYLAGETVEFRNADGRKNRFGSTSAITVQSADDVVNKVVDRVYFYNVYADGTMGATTHTTLENARLRAKIGKCRIGIIEMFSEDGVVTASRYHACTPTTRKRYEVSLFPKPATYPTVRASVAENNA